MGSRGVLMEDESGPPGWRRRQKNGEASGDCGTMRMVGEARLYRFSGALCVFGEHVLLLLFSKRLMMFWEAGVRWYVRLLRVTRK